MPKRLRLNHCLPLRTILVCTPKRRSWLLSNYNHDQLSIRPVLERHFVRLLNHYLIVSFRVPLYGQLLYV